METKLFLDRHLKRLQSVSQKIQSTYNSSASRTLHLTSATGAFKIALGLGKILLGMLSLSVFTCVNGLYTLGMAEARYCALLGAVRTQDTKEQYRYYRNAAQVMIVASLLHVAYSIWLYFHPKPVYYGKILAITIATVVFTEIGLNLKGVIQYRKGATPLLHAIKTINLGASLISLVLTQSANLAFADEVQNPSANRILGALMGSGAALLGLYMLVRVRHMADPEDFHTENRRLNRLVKKLGLSSTVHPLQKEYTVDGLEHLTVVILPALSDEDAARICAQARRQYEFNLEIQ